MSRKKEKLKKNKLVVILGPTASGKTDLSIKLALHLKNVGGRPSAKLQLKNVGGRPSAKFLGGEVVSADSRQVYKGMDIGTGKITKKEMQGIPHHLLDVVSPNTRFTVSQYQKKAKKIIKEIQKRNKLPFLVGGTGFYIQAIVDGITLPEVKPNWKLRKKLEEKTAQELFRKLKKLDPKRAKNIDRFNKRRLIRALEIVLKTKKPVPSLKKEPIDSAVLFLGIKKDSKELKKLIKKRLLKRLRQGMIAEVKRLHDPPSGKGISWKRLEEFGLEYRYISIYLQNKITKEEMIEKLQKEIEHYAKRQMTWFKKDTRVHWVKNQKTAQKLLTNFLN